jgi:hypothetical protein
MCHSLNAVDHTVMLITCSVYSCSVQWAAKCDSGIEILSGNLTTPHKVRHILGEKFFIPSCSNINCIFLTHKFPPPPPNNSECIGAT